MSNKVVKGTLVLSGMVLLTKVIGFFFWIPFQNIAGDDVIGVYRQSFPFYNILLMIASAGIPITISKFVAERLAKNDTLGARKVLRTGSILLSLTGLISSAFLYFGSEFIARMVLDDKALVTVPSLKVLALSILIVPVMGVLRGYFQGHQEMMPTGLSQFVEQVIRVGVLICITLYMVNANQPFIDQLKADNPKITDAEIHKLVNQGEARFTDADIAAGATSGAFFGAIGGLLVVLWYNRRDKKQKGPLHSSPLINGGTPLRSEVKESYWGLSKKIITYAIPISLATLVLPLLGVADAATVPRILQDLGMTTTEATRQYGIYYRADPLINVISVFSSSLTLVLIPAISAHIAKKEFQEVENRIQQSWLMTLVISLPCSLALSLLAEPINIAFNKNALGSSTMSILAFSAVFSTLAVTSSGILQGMGHNNIPVRHLLIGATIKVAGNFLLIPKYGLEGSAFAMVVCFATVCILNMWTVIRKSEIKFAWKDNVFKPVLSAVLFGFVIYGTYHLLADLFLQEPSRILYFVVVAVAGMIAAILYFFTLIWTRTLKEDDIRSLPMGTRLLRSVPNKRT